MLSYLNKMLKNERGATSASVVLMAFVIAVTAAALVSRLQASRTAKKLEAQLDTDRRLNESALQVVTQLVANGVIYYSPDCKMALPQSKGMKDVEYSTGCNPSTSTTLDCLNPDAPNWLYSQNEEKAVVDVCVPLTEKNAAGAYEITKIPMKVIFKSFKKETIERPSTKIAMTEDEMAAVETNETETVERVLGRLVVQRPGVNKRGNPYPKLDGEVNFGVVQDANQGLLGKHGGADVCFYMRPRTVSQGALAMESDDREVKSYSGYRDRFDTTESAELYKRYRREDLEPRSDGLLADQYGAYFDWDELIKVDDPDEDKKEEKQKKLDKKFHLLKKFAKKVEVEYKAGSRVGRDALGGNWGSGAVSATLDVSSTRITDDKKVIMHERYRTGRKAYKKYFVGVMPQYGSEEGPQFKHFLTGSKSEPDKWKKWNENLSSSENKERINNFLDDLKEGCKENGKSSESTFCTRVNIPYRKHTLSTRKRCKMVEHTIPTARKDEPVKVMYSNASVNVSCDDGWVDKVMNLYESRIIADKDEAKKADLKKEINFDQLISALEVDDDFRTKSGVWSDDKFENGGSRPHPKEEYESYRGTVAGRLGGSLDGNQIKFEGDKQYDCNPYQCNPRSCNCRCSGTDANGNCTGTTCDTCYDTCYETCTPPDKRFSVWTYEDAPNELTHTSKVCSYTYYKEPARPYRCRYNFKTELNEDFVCRTDDGCFDEDTRIRMADGTDRLIKKLKMGDLVLNPVTGNPAKIVKLVIGEESKPLIHVSVDGRMVRVTSTHPFMTRRGWVLARNLRKSDELLASGRRYLPVRSIELGALGRTVVNLALEGPADQGELHYVLADGVVTGDLVIQNMLEAQAQKDAKP